MWKPNKGGIAGAQSDNETRVVTKHVKGPQQSRENYLEAYREWEIKDSVEICGKRKVEQAKDDTKTREQGKPGIRRKRKQRQKNRTYQSSRRDHRL